MERLKSELEKLQESLKKQSGAWVIRSADGPVGIAIIREIARVLEAHEEEITALKAQIALQSRLVPPIGTQQGLSA